jgi:hypothetical protein
MTVIKVSSNKLTCLTSLRVIRPNKLLHQRDSARKNNGIPYLSVCHTHPNCRPFINLYNVVVLTLVVALMLHDVRATNCAIFHDTIPTFVCRNSDVPRCWRLGTACSRELRRYILQPVCPLPDVLHWIRFVTRGFRSNPPFSRRATNIACHTW